MTTIELNKKPEITEADREEIRLAKQKEIVYDEDSPRYSKEELIALIKAKKAEEQSQLISIRVKASTVKNAKSLGKGYTTIMARVLNNVFSNPELLKKCI